MLTDMGPQFGVHAAVIDSYAQETEMAAVLRQYRTETGRSLLELVDESPVLLIFLRHFGCSFCRQTLDDVSRIRDLIEAKGVRPVFVHLGSPERAKPYFDYYHLSDVERVSDPGASLYASSVCGCSATFHGYGAGSAPAGQRKRT